MKILETLIVAADAQGRVNIPSLKWGQRYMVRSSATRIILKPHEEGPLADQQHRVRLTPGIFVPGEGFLVIEHPEIGAFSLHRIKIVDQHTGNVIEP